MDSKNYLYFLDTDNKDEEEEEKVNVLDAVEKSERVNKGTVPSVVKILHIWFFPDCQSDYFNGSESFTTALLHSHKSSLSRHFRTIF